MAYIRKTVDRWDIMGNYGYGWECECSEYTLKEAKQRLKEYLENGSGCYRLEKHREKKKRRGRSEKTNVVPAKEILKKAYGLTEGHGLSIAQNVTGKTKKNSRIGNTQKKGT
jgi:hypothetical protein